MAVEQHSKVPAPVEEVCQNVAPLSTVVEASSLVVVSYGVSVAASLAEAASSAEAEEEASHHATEVAAVVLFLPKLFHPVALAAVVWPWGSSGWVPHQRTLVKTSPLPTDLLLPHQRTLALVLLQQPFLLFLFSLPQQLAWHRPHQRTRGLS